MPSHPSPTYERLRHTIAKQMRMSPIDQPLMLMEQLGRHSPAPAQDVAHRQRHRGDHQHPAGALLPLQCRQAMAIVGLRVAPAGIDSDGWNLMPHLHSFRLDLKHAIDQISVFPVLDQLQS